MHKYFIVYKSLLKYNNSYFAPTRFTKKRARRILYCSAVPVGFPNIPILLDDSSQQYLKIVLTKYVGNR